MRENEREREREVERERDIYIERDQRERGSEENYSKSTNK